ncbi:MAG: hypothetical protein JWQ25_107 [Daejeonella sp.]|nr:hypothetical protein [Daejeonella sp.]
MIHPAKLTKDNPHFMRTKIVFFLIFCFSHVNAQTPGNVSDTITCRADSKQQYAFYLPKDYVSTSTYPLLIFSDPGGRAQLPIKNYKLLADRYHLIMACSYQSKNGPFQSAIEATYAMLKDINERFSIDTSITILSGFSGGARLASLLAINDNRFSGVIACGATFPNGIKILEKDKFPYAIIIGDHDMNYLEAVQTSAYLKKIQNPYTKITFKGNHTWPDVDKFEEAIGWHLMKKGLLNQEQINHFYEKSRTEIKMNIDSGSWIPAYELAENLVSNYGLPTSNHSADSVFKSIAENPNYLKEKKNEAKLLALEETWRTTFYDKYSKASEMADSSFKEKDWIYLKEQFNRLRLSKEKNKILMGERLLNLGWLTCAEQSNQLFSQKNYGAAFLSTQIWSVFKSDDFYPFLMLARIKAAQNSKESLVYLNKAFEKGFKDKAFLENDSSFEFLRKMPAYQKLIAKL